MVDKSETLQLSYHWFANVYKYSVVELEHQALKLTNLAKCTFIKLDSEEYEYSGDKKIKYYIVAEGTKQKLLLLEHLMKAWIYGSNYIPRNFDKVK